MKKRVLSLLLVLCLLASLVPGAWALPTIPDLKADSNGLITWSAVSGASSYRVRGRVNASTLGPYESALTQTVTKTSFDAKALLDSLNRTNSSYEFEVTAMSGTTEIAMGRVTFFFKSTRKTYSAIRNLRWNGTTAAWDPVEGATEYTFALYRSFSAGSGMFSVVGVVDTTATSVDITTVYTKAKSDLSANYEFLFKVSAVGNEKYYQGYEYTSEWITGSKLLAGYKTPVEITGTATIAVPYPGYYLRPSYSGEIYRAFRANESKLHHQWQRGSSATGVFDDIVGETDRLYVVSGYDVGDYLRVKVTVDGYKGYLYSNAVQVAKLWALPAEAPELSVSGTSLTVTNGKASQEYLVTTALMSDADDLDWSSATSPSADGAFPVAATANEVNYVYTRSKATATREAGKGEEILSANAYVGTVTTQVSALKLEVGTLKGNTTSTGFTGRRRSREEVFVTTDRFAVGDVAVLRVTARPSGADFEGVRGDRWGMTTIKELVRGSLEERVKRSEIELEKRPIGSRGSVGFYADPGCETPLSADKYYTFAFVPLSGAVSGLTFTVTHSIDSGETLTASAVIDVADTTGRVAATTVTFPDDVVLIAGDRVEGWQVSALPKSASLEGLTLSCLDAAAPTVTFDSETGTLTVDASSASAGEYAYAATLNDASVGTLLVTVGPKVSIPVDEMRFDPEELALAPGQSAALCLLTYPMGAVPELTYAISNPEVLSVAEGTVTVSPDAKPGATVQITAKEKGSGLVAKATVTVTEITSKPPYTITLDPQWGTVLQETRLTDESGKLAFLLTPYWEGHTFYGWYTTPEGGDKIDTDYVFTGNTTIYALWEAPKKAVKIDLTGASSWAVAEVTEAITHELVPDDLQSAYTQDITREEFCRLMIQFLDKVWNTDVVRNLQDMDELDMTKFTDTENPVIFAANHLGIVNGRGGSIFDPEGSITRQEAACMLARTASLLPLKAIGPIVFQDRDTFASWAVESIDFVSGLVDPVNGKAVMGGVGSGNFGPLATYTREQSFLTSIRLWDCDEAD